MFAIFLQQDHDSNWVPFFKPTYKDAQQFAEDKIKEKGHIKYVNYYVCEILDYSHDFSQG